MDVGKVGSSELVMNVVGAQGCVTVGAGERFKYAGGELRGDAKVARYCKAPAQVHAQAVLLRSIAWAAARRYWEVPRERNNKKYWGKAERHRRPSRDNGASPALKIAETVRCLASTRWPDHDLWGRERRRSDYSANMGGRQLVSCLCSIDRDGQTGPEPTDTTRWPVFGGVLRAAPHWTVGVKERQNGTREASAARERQNGWKGDQHQGGLALLNTKVEVALTNTTRMKMRTDRMLWSDHDGPSLHSLLPGYLVSRDASSSYPERRDCGLWAERLPAPASPAYPSEDVLTVVCFAGN